MRLGWLPYTRLNSDNLPPTLTAGTAVRVCFRLDAKRIDDDAAVHTLHGVNATQLGYAKPALEDFNEMKSWRGNPPSCVGGQWRVFAFYANDVTRALNGYCWPEDIGGGLGPRTLWRCRLRNYPWEKYGGLWGNTDFLDFGSARERDSRYLPTQLANDRGTLLSRHTGLYRRGTASTLRLNLPHPVRGL